MPQHTPTHAHPTHAIKRFLTFNSVFSKLFMSVLLALILFAIAMMFLTRLVHDTSTHTRHQILASQVTQQLEPMLQDLHNAQANQERLESRYLMALIRRNFAIYGESMNARFGLYDGTTRLPIVLMDNLPETLPPDNTDMWDFFRHDDPKATTQVQIPSQSGYVVLYESNRPSKPPVPPVFNLITGTLLLLLIMAAMLWFITRTMTWRINQLSHQMTQFGEGNFSARVTAVGNDEITTLAKGFNKAAERIESLMNANKLLLAHASHEIRTPITRMRLQVEMMSMLTAKFDELTQEKFAKRADAINRDLNGLNDLIESILLVSRLDAGHALDKMEMIDMYELIKGEVQHYPQASFSGSQVFIEGQPSLLTHLLRNLLDNAHLHGVPPVSVELYAIDNNGNRLDLPVVNDKSALETPPDITITVPSIALAMPWHYTSPLSYPQVAHKLPTDFSPLKFNYIAPKKTSVSTTASLKKIAKINPKNLFSRKKADKSSLPIISYDRIRIAVIDQGSGIPLDKRQEIFSPFVRLKQEKKGSGLGLSLVSQIVTAHGGTIITDTIDEHTRFLVTLPTSQHG